MPGTRYLLAAEADKIQDFVFRASRLREVSGGSALLTRFCEEVPTQCLGLKPDDVIVSDGGTFRLLFDTAAAAEVAGCTLADLYYMATGCGLTVAPPVPFDPLDPASFPSANCQASTALRSAKRAQPSSTTAHIPQMAYCASTGIELAANFSIPKSDRRATYLSKATLTKQRERQDGKEAFIAKFIELVVPEGKADEFDVPEDAGAIGRAGGYDPRDYVAYLVADGNGMGALFERCQTPELINRLSTRLSEIVRKSLVKPTQQLMRFAPSKQGADRIVPLLPLILGGDDLFALLPAPWALSFAQCFCRNFEYLMGQFIAETPELADGPRPTMASAVVICKSKFPFYLAHQRGEALLKEVKQLSKGPGQGHYSAVSFEVNVGNRLFDSARTADYRPTLRPYWIVPEQTSTVLPDESIPLQSLIDARYTLRMLPQKRQALVREQFEQVKHEELKSRADRLKEIADRMGQFADTPEDLSTQLLTYLEALGSDRGAHYWRTVSRGDKYVYGNALPDVLDAWDYLYDIEREPASYETGIL